MLNLSTTKTTSAKQRYFLASDKEKAEATAAMFSITSIASTWFQYVKQLKGLENF